MFESLLIANRGEIACRVARTARRLGIRTIAVFSDADRDALHVQSCDEAVHIGPASARQSYLDMAAIVEAARRTGAQAVHPGYGFLSENADFAQACLDAGLVFVGPSPAAIRAMGSKSAGKAIMAAAGVPLVPGYHGEDQSLDVLQREADAIGYPVLVKASAGGGGRGMRIVQKPEELKAAVDAAKRESKGAFGDDRLLLEKYLARPRHVEVQVFGDDHGNAIHLFERDCSIQRRHQKVVEEAPAPGLAHETRRAMGAAAVAAARAIDYSGAGTVEFLLDASGAFYFIEMNTRLQVEHPVTEFVVGHDLVEWQLRVAAGDPLPVVQEQVDLNGHAIEVRLYAEDPARNFMPQTGTLRHLRFPAEGPHVRVDSGVAEGDTISVNYDPMIAKLIVWDRDRPAAVRRLRQALGDFQVAGLTTNAPFLAAVAAHPAFAAGDVETHFIEHHAGDLFPTAEPVDDTMLALACLSVLLTGREAAAERAAGSADPWSPWHRADAWRLNGAGGDLLQFRDGERAIAVPVAFTADGWRLDLPGGEVALRGERDGAGDLVADVGGLRLTATVVAEGADLILIAQGRARRLTVHDPAAAAAEADTSGGKLTSPMPGKVVRVLVEAGQAVKRGAPLVVLEAMKMEHTIAAPSDGTVERIAYGVGETVEEGVELVAFAPA